MKSKTPAPAETAAPAASAAQATAPAPAPILGGSYVLQPDGQLERVESTDNSAPEAQQTTKE